VYDEEEEKEKWWNIGDKSSVRKIDLFYSHCLKLHR
jgi:hypothetical protein